MIDSGSAGSSYNTSVAMEFFRFAGKPKAFAKGKKIFSENQRGIPFLLMPNRMYLLLDGEVGIFARDKPVGTIHPGQIFGEMASIDQGPRTGTALARTACRVISLDDRQMRAALGKYPEFALMLMSVMIGRLRESIGRVQSSDSPAARTKWMHPAPLREDLINDLARVLGPEAHMTYDSGNTIVREGQVGVLMYVVLKGRVAIRAGEKLIETVGPGGIFGEMALVDRTPRLASVVAEGKVRLLAINRAAFLNLVKHSRRFAASLLGAVSARARYAASR
jgi:CRP/FNR family transcriptional regulator, cyclic AMP receptor protein